MTDPTGPDHSGSRRRFLQLTGAGVAASPWLAACATAAPSAIPARAMGMPWPDWGTLPEEVPPPPKPGSVGVAVVGLGGYAIGKALPALATAEGTHVAAVVSGNPEKAAKVAAAYGVPEDAVYSYETFAQIANDDRVEAVYIVLPTGLHAEWTELAFAAGKHVICEKPMALNAGECARMIAASEAANRKLMIAYRCHFEPYNLKATELMRAGAVGAIRSIETANNYSANRAHNPSNDWRLVKALAGGGPLEDYGLYGLQAALYLSGEVPVSVRGWTEQVPNDPRFTEVFSTVKAEITFPSGAVTKLVTSYNADNLNMVKVTGSDGILLMEPATYYDGNAMKLLKGGTEEVLMPGDSNLQFSRMVQHFAEAIRTGAAIKTPGEMGLRDIRLVEAIHRSAAMGEVVAV
ncbi:MAG: Gfo/Idh/MocA family oxidoreductase [Hyphomonas sp.]|uniref:Gfo/Idh/MocA family protein n=1 Tax=Hyphomonas sp. TaxID=87 RepID=UPI003528D055